MGDNGAGDDNVSKHTAPDGSAVDDNGRKHIDLVQGAISRMASASSASKGWLLPVVTATYGYALTQHSRAVAVLGIFATLLFCSLDAQYLRQERAFRALYRAVVNKQANLFDMNNRIYYGKPNGDAEDAREENCRWTKIILSWSIAGFYLPIIIVGVIIILTTVNWSSVFCSRPV